MRTGGRTEAAGANAAASALAALLAARVPGFAAHARFGDFNDKPDESLQIAAHAGPRQRDFVAALWLGAPPRDRAPFVAPRAATQEHTRAGATDADFAHADCADADRERSAEASAARQNAHAGEVARARENGFTAGFDAGRGAAEVELGAGVAELDRLAGALVSARSIDAPALAAALAQTVHALLAELLDDHPDLAAHGVETRARRALDALATPCVLWLAPADATALATPLARPGLSVVADPTLARGALRLTNATSRLDDSPAARLDRLAPMLTEAAAHAAALDASEAQRAA